MRKFRKINIKDSICGVCGGLVHFNAVNFPSIKKLTSQQLSSYICPTCKSLVINRFKHILIEQEQQKKIKDESN